jgi:hypothetical protein
MDFPFWVNRGNQEDQGGELGESNPQPVDSNTNNFPVFQTLPSLPAICLWRVQRG